MANRDILAIGTSAGGIDALLCLARGFAKDLPATVLVVLHLPSRPPSSLDAVLTQAGPLPAQFAEDGQSIARGRIYIAPPGRHLLLDGDLLRLGIGPRENSVRPAIDPLFRSVGLCCGPRAVGAVLTGTMGDGGSGLQSLRQCGGLTVVQDPEDAAFSSMPRAALSRGEVDHVETLAGLPALLDSLARKPAGPHRECPENVRLEVDVARGGRSTMAMMDRIGYRSPIACPDCSGVLWEIEDGTALRYRCHIGHAFAAEFVDFALDDAFSRALGSAYRALNERLAVTRSLERQANERGHAQSAAGWARKGRELEAEAEVIRDSIKRVDDLAFRAARAAA